MVREQICIHARACNTQYASMPCRVTFTVAAVNGYASCIAIVAVCVRYSNSMNQKPLQWVHKLLKEI